jgi:hypothetical protein
MISAAEYRAELRRDGRSGQDTGSRGWSRSENPKMRSQHRQRSQVHREHQPQLVSQGPQRCHRAMYRRIRTFGEGREENRQNTDHRDDCDLRRPRSRTQQGRPASSYTHNTDGHIRHAVARVREVMEDTEHIELEELNVAGPNSLA